MIGTDNRVAIVPGAIITGPVFSEPVEVITVERLGEALRIVGSGIRTGMTHRPTLTAEQVAGLSVSPSESSYDGDARNFRLGTEAMRLGLAYEYDPYFALSIARVDPLPHQLEAVYEYFLKLPRIRFLLADDPGAGKTIMAGLLIKELKIRGLVKRILILTPASLSFQWQRELRDKFRENFEVLNGGVLRTNYGSNPWQEKDQVVTSVSWVSTIEDAKASLLRSHWDLVIVDEAHKMSASGSHRTLAYQLGEALSEMTDHYLLMTATPHKGDAKNFSLFLSLLDKDVYGDVKSLEEAVKRRSAPFYLRRVKEALKTFPDPETGLVKQLFTKREVKTSEFKINTEEVRFYDELTEYVEEQSSKAAADNSPQSRALGFTMAMLQRRFASSIYAVRRTLERMKSKREEILKDPEKYRSQQIQKRIPDAFEDLPEEERAEIMTQIEDVVGSYRPADLREEIATLTGLINRACELERQEVESKLSKLKELLQEQRIFDDPKMKLLIFTEHKDTLDFLVGDGEGGRPLGKLREWGLSVTQIHGGMKIGDRDTPGTRIYAEKEFKETCQVMVATEAAGEGINLQFCWLMINYDIPWNPMRLEQRMGRIHRYGQEKDCMIFNFVSTRTREGRVLQKLFERIDQIERDLDPEHTGKVFNVIGDVFPANELEKMIRDMYARNSSEQVIKDRIIKEIDVEHFKRITNSTLEGLAKRELNLNAIVGKTELAKERRLVPEVIEAFFRDAAPVVGVTSQPVAALAHTYRIGKLPRTLAMVGDRLESRYGKLGREYGRIAFDKKLLTDDPTLEWVTPGHPLFEAVREGLLHVAGDDMQRGAVFYDLHRTEPARLDVFKSSVKDGLGNTVHQRLFVVEVSHDGTLDMRQPTLLLDLNPAPHGTSAPDGEGLPDRKASEDALTRHLLGEFLEEARSQRQKETETIRRHLKLSFEELIHRQNERMIVLHEQQNSGAENPNLTQANLASTQSRIDELHHRWEKRRLELDREAQVTIADTLHLGSAWVLPHPERTSSGIAPMVSDPEIERIAVEAVTKFEGSRGWRVKSVEKDNKGFDLISSRYSPEDSVNPVESRFIEVKGRAAVGEVALTSNEYLTAERLREDYWLYVVYNCVTAPEITTIRDPFARLLWKPVVKVEHYHVSANDILNALAMSDDSDSSNPWNQLPFYEEQVAKLQQRVNQIWADFNDRGHSMAGHWSPEDQPTEEELKQSRLQLGSSLETVISEYDDIGPDYYDRAVAAFALKLHDCTKAQCPFGASDPRRRKLYDHLRDLHQSLLTYRADFEVYKNELVKLITSPISSNGSIIEDLIARLEKHLTLISKAAEQVISARDTIDPGQVPST